MKFCPECGAQLTEGALSCKDCGAVFAPAQPAYTNVNPAVQPAYINPVAQPGVPPVQPVYPPQGNIPQQPQYPEAQPAGPDDDIYPINVTHKGFWWLGFACPPAGLAFHIAWKRFRPRLSRSAGKGALVGAIVNGVAYSVLWVIYVVLFTLLETAYYY